MITQANTTELKTPVT